MKGETLVDKKRNSPSLSLSPYLYYNCVTRVCTRGVLWFLSFLTAFISSSTLIFVPTTKLFRNDTRTFEIFYFQSFILFYFFYFSSNLFEKLKYLHSHVDTIYTTSFLFRKKFFCAGLRRNIFVKITAHKYLK